ncbi:uncharacterized protein LOC115321961 [Ixodes scapularis]|uniref:uncharacterized protein LOC115321961 n=1 Tax=Ixodes scapularis TaxID=6945 RepID=UPI001C387213|nr:uncharacterized protein LOC115321961 [Ixodes scapularis]
MYEAGSKAWLRYAKRDDLLQKSSSELHAKYFVCSSHFTARDFMDPGRTKLMKTAVPSVRPSTYSDAERAKDFMEATTPPCGADPMEATASSFRPEEPSTAAHDSMEATPPPCGVDPIEASAPSCGAASSFRPKEPSTAAHDSMEATASPCGADSTEATAPSCSWPLDFRPVTPSTWSSSEPVGACTSTPPLRSSAPRPKDIIRRLQAKVSKYRKTIARLRKQEKNMPRSAAEALNIIRPHVTDEVFHLLSSHVKLKSKGKGKRFPLWLKKFSLHLNFRGPHYVIHFYKNTIME